ncbi:MAG: M81 family peptidase [Alphaproteobacteria bacterium]|nr:M81 family peptidase [Alphaproteobacteria bacterium]
MIRQRGDIVDMTKRVLVAGFQHETNTFGATRASFRDFEVADSWPGLLEGIEVFSGLEGTSLPLAGFIRAAEEREDIELIPILWCAAEPSAQVTDDAYEEILGRILDGIASHESLDGIYLDLHGAMVTMSFDDGEGECLARIRQLVGPDIPLVISLDSHANVTQAMVRHASAMTMFRSYPHLDMAETGARAFHVLQYLMDGGQVFPSFHQSPYLIPLHAQYTGIDPLKRIYDSVRSVGPAPQTWAELSTGFPAADIHDAGPSILVYASSKEEAAAISSRLLNELEGAEPSFDISLIELHRGDAPGAGGTSDTTGILQALVNAEAKGVILGMLNDPDVAREAHVQGVGSIFQTSLGGKAGPNPQPFDTYVEVLGLSDGKFAFTGEMYAGSVAEAGLSALIRVAHINGDIRIVLSSTRCQCLDQAIFTHIGVRPEEASIIVVKSTVHFRADFDALSTTVLNTKAPGLMPCELEQVPYRKLRKGVRLSPLGRVRG